MELVCNKCHAKYRISDEKVAGRKVVKIRCRKCANIIEKSNEPEELFRPNNLDSFDFDDAKTLVYNKDHENQTKPKQNPNPLNQLVFDDVTKQENINKLNGNNSFDLTREIAIPGHFQKKSKNVLKNNNQSLDLGLKHSAPLNSNSYSKPINNARRGVKSANNDYSNNDYSMPDEKTSVFLMLIFFLLILTSSLFIFILYRNDWKLDLNNIDKMVNNTIHGIKKKDTVKEIPLDKQFLISKDIKIDIFKNRKKKNLLVISGFVSNQANTPKSIVTIRADILDKENNAKLFSKRVYIGNVFTKEQLKKFKTELDLNAEYLQSGQDSSNWQIPVGKRVPYMIVFYTKKPIKEEHINVKLKVTSSQ